jgi:hypothetical protein
MAKRIQEVWTMKRVVCLWLLLPLQALGATLVIPTVPARVDISEVKFYRLAYGFQEDESGRFQLQVNVYYRPLTSRIERVKHVTLQLQSGTIVPGDGQTLVLRHDNREVVVGQHRWWYDPYWQAADDVRLICDHTRQGNKIILENCRLMVDTPAFGERHGLARPAVQGTPTVPEVNRVATKTKAMTAVTQTLVGPLPPQLLKVLRADPHFDQPDIHKPRPQ